MIYIGRKKCICTFDVNPPCLASIQINSRMEFVHQLTQKRILTFIRFSAYRTWIGTIPNCGKRGYSETQFRHKKHRKRLSKTRDMQIRNSKKLQASRCWVLSCLVLSLGLPLGLGPSLWCPHHIMYDKMWLKDFSDIDYI